MKYILLFGTVLICTYVYMAHVTSTQNTVRINDTTYRALVADTDVRRSKGLSGRNDMDSKNVMLFKFDRPGVYGFWMKDMLFSIDILWTNEVGDKVLYVEQNVSPDTYPRVFYPPNSSMYVIEAKAGEFATIKVGDVVEIR